jgi:MoaA/NifB/PqqE/SkfB family radical SAM enzyme
MLIDLNEDLRIAITTNLKENIVPFVREISPAKVFSITASYHPTSMSLEMFMGKVLLLKNKGFRVVVNFVTWPEQMYLLPRVKKEVEDAGLIFHTDPYAPTPYMPYEWDAYEQNFLKSFVGDDRAPREQQPRPVLCSAGMDHLTVMPDGKAYRCLNDVIAGRQPVGLIFDKTFSLNTTATFCDEYHKCAGCNRDKVTVSYVDA